MQYASDERREFAVRSNPNNSTIEAVVAQTVHRLPTVEEADSVERRTASLDTDMAALTGYVDELGAHVKRRGLNEKHADLLAVERNPARRINAAEP
jgi:hypothetical protein